MTTLRQDLADPRSRRQIEIWERGEGIRARFLEFHREHPEVLRMLLTIARRERARGWRRLAIVYLFEILRQRLGPNVQDKRGFKLNNDFRSHYARALVQEDPSLEGLFEFRSLRSD